jgi:hypothetical protein
MLIPIAIAVEVPIALAIRARKVWKATGEVEIMPDYSDEVWRILMDAYTKMRRGGVSVPNPWISACIAEVERGGGCPVDVAVKAVSKTLDDLRGYRYDVSYLEGTIEQLKGLGA